MRTLLFFLINFINIQFLYSSTTELGHFTGRVSKINTKANLIRVRVDFENVKYLNKNDQVEFWDQSAERKCLTDVVAKGNRYLLLKIPKMEVCSNRVSFTVGAYLNFFSKELKSNIQLGKELLELLVQKRIAVESKLNKSKIDLEQYVEKAGALNQKYQVLRQKLELEWQKELTLIEEDKNVALIQFKNFEMQLGEIDHKIQKYRVEDDNLKLDRWALDPKLYFKK